MEFAAAYTDAGSLELRDLASDRPVWSVPLIGPSVDDSASIDADAVLHLIEFSPDGRFVLSYESHQDGSKGTLVIREAREGAVAAMYDVSDVSDLAVAPDGKTFAFSTRGSAIHTAVVHVPF